MKKVLYGFLFFLIGIGYFLLSWASWLMIWVQPLFILPLDILLVFFTCKLYIILNSRYIEVYQETLLLIFVLLMPVIFNLATLCISIYFYLFDTKSIEFEDSVAGILFAFLSFKGLIFSTILMTFSLANTSDEIIKVQTTDSPE